METAIFEETRAIASCSRSSARLVRMSAPKTVLNGKQMAGARRTGRRLRVDAILAKREGRECERDVRGVEVKGEGGWVRDKRSIQRVALARRLAPR